MQEWYNKCLPIIDIAARILIPMTALILSINALIVSKKQLKIAEVGYKPIFKIDIFYKNIDNDSRDLFLKIINKGYPVNSKIETKAVMINEIVKNGIKKYLFINLENYFWDLKDMMENGRNDEGVICERSTNFAKSYLSSSFIKVRDKVHKEFKNDKIQIFTDDIYYTKISYKNNYNKQENKYYKIGRFENKEILSKQYDRELENIFSINIGNYLNEDIEEKLRKIFIDFVSAM